MTPLSDVAAQLALLLVGWALYRQVRLRTTDEAIARANANLLLDAQAGLNLAVERTINSAMASADALAWAANWQYLLHFPLTIGTGVWLFVAHRSRGYVVFRDSLLVATGVGLLIHLFFPLAPPRMMPDFIDVTASVGPSPYSFPGSGQANQFAAMPSMHVAWAVLVASSVRDVADRPLVRIAAATHALTTGAVVLLLAHHYVLDVLVALAIVELARRVARWRLRRTAGGPSRRDADATAHALRRLSPSPHTHCAATPDSRPQTTPKGSPDVPILCLADTALVEPTRSRARGGCRRDRDPGQLHTAGGALQRLHGVQPRLGRGRGAERAARPVRGHLDGDPPDRRHR
ncbi:MAG: phosphatase PAP2 family protein [Actinomycetota bacterium]